MDAVHSSLRNSDRFDDRSLCQRKRHKKKEKMEPNKSPTDFQHIQVLRKTRRASGFCRSDPLMMFREEPMEGDDGLSWKSAEAGADDTEDTASAGGMV